MGYQHTNRPGAEPPAWPHPRAEQDDRQAVIGVSPSATPARPQWRAEFDQYYRASYPSLVALQHALLGDRDHARAVVGAAFSSAWVHWSTVRELPDPIGWVRRTADQVAVRGHQRARPEDPAERVGPCPPDLRAATGVALDSLAGLPLVQRRAVALHHIAGLSVTQIAEEEHAPVPVITERLAHGRLRLAAPIASLEPLRSTADVPPVEVVFDRVSRHRRARFAGAAAVIVVGLLGVTIATQRVALDSSPGRPVASPISGYRPAPAAPTQPARDPMGSPPAAPPGPPALPSSPAGARGTSDPARGAGPSAPAAPATKHPVEPLIPDTDRDDGDGTGGSGGSDDRTRRSPAEGRLDRRPAVPPATADDDDGDDSGRDPRPIQPWYVDSQPTEPWHVYSRPGHPYRYDDSSPRGRSQPAPDRAAPGWRRPNPATRPTTPRQRPTPADRPRQADRPRYPTGFEGRNRGQGSHPPADYGGREGPYHDRAPGRGGR